jgi:hypothetical protein
MILRELWNAGGGKADPGEDVSNSGYISDWIRSFEKPARSTGQS